jgi:hypothetical protein
MYPTLEHRRKNAPKSRGQKEICTEIKKTEKKFTQIKKRERERNMHRTLEDSRK